MAGTPEDQDREASEQDQYQESTVCHDCLYRYQGDCRHSHGPLVPNKGVCGGKVLVQAKAPAPLPINAKLPGPAGVRAE